MSTRQMMFIPNVLFAILLAHGSATAQPQQVLQGATKMDRGVRLPTGETRPGDGKPMLVHDEWSDETVVGKLVLSSRLGAVLEMPSGRLQYARKADLQATDRPFVPADRKELGRLLVKRFFPGFKVKTSKHYLFVYNSTDNFQKGTQAILESLLTGVLSRFKKLDFDVHEPHVPLIVLMFRTEAEYRKHFNPTTGWTAFYNHNVNFIAMFEERTAVDEQQAHARKRAITTIAHEGTHQLMTNIGVQQRMSRWPLWTTEGIADYFAPTEVGTKLKWAGPGKVHEGRLYNLVKQLEARRGKPIDGSLVKSTVAAAQLDGDGYAAAWALTYYLSKKQTTKYLAYLREVSSIEPNRGVPRKATTPVIENLTLFEKHFGDDWVSIERDWFTYIVSLRKQYEAEHVYYVSFMQTTAGRQMQRTTAVSTSAGAARQWQTAQLKKLAPALRRTTRFNLKSVRGRSAAEATAQAWLKS
jgi:hypothetical protein